MASFSVGQGKPSSLGRKINRPRMQVRALVVRMVLMLSVAATVQAVTVDNTMTEQQTQHAILMASVPILQHGCDDIGIGCDVMALHPNGQMWPGQMDGFTDDTVVFTVMFLDGSSSSVSLHNIHHRDDTVSYENFGRTGLHSVHVNTADMPGGMRSGNGGSAAAGGSEAGSSRPASLHANPLREVAMRALISRLSAADRPVVNTDGPPVVFRSAGSRVTAAPRNAGSSVSAAPRNAVLGNAAQGGVAAFDLGHFLDLQQQARRCQHESNRARLACSAAIRQRDQHRDAHEITVETLMRRTAECNAMRSERDEALDAVDARDTAMQVFQAAHGAEGKKRKADNSADSVDFEQRVRTVENERDMALETRNTAIAARVAAEQTATFATQRAEASDLRATAAEHRVAVMQQELQAAQAEIAALRRAGASDDAACCNVKDKGSRN